MGSYEAVAAAAAVRARFGAIAGRRAREGDNEGTVIRMTKIIPVEK